MKKVIFRFRQVFPENVASWTDEDAGKALYALECSKTDWRSKGRSVHALLTRRLPRHAEALEKEFLKRHGEPVENQPLSFVVRTKTRMSGQEDVVLTFFRFESEVRAVERSVLVRKVMER